MKEKSYPPSYNSRKYVLLSPILLTASRPFLLFPNIFHFDNLCIFLRSTTRIFCRVFVHTFNWCNTSQFLIMISIRKPFTLRNMLHLQLFLPIVTWNPHSNMLRWVNVCTFRVLWLSASVGACLLINRIVTTLRASLEHFNAGIVMH